MSVAAAKAALRREVAAKLRGIDGARREAAGRQAAGHLRGAGLDVDRIAVYDALPDELPLGSVAAWARDAGLELLWPRVRRGRLEFAPCEDEAALVPGRYGTRVPPAERAAAQLDARSALLVPGRAFDRRGGRLGRGQGWYDRALAESSGALAIGVGYELQVVGAVPVEPHDRAVAALLTERGFRRIAP